MTVAVYTNMRKDTDLAVTERVVKYLDGKCHIIFRKDYDSFGDMCASCDALVILGGDGTILNAARVACDYDKPILGINLGTVGFLAEVELDKIEACLDRFLAGEYEIEQRFMIKAEIIRDGNVISTYKALNDVVVSAASFKKVVSTDIFVDDDYIASYDADGVVIATPTGSTAYSLSAGGPITDNTMKLILVTPICAHTLSSRPLILPPDKTITVELTRDREAASFLTIDGNDGEKLLKGDKVVISASEHTTKLIRVNGMNFYEILRKKIGN